MPGAQLPRGGDRDDAADLMPLAEPAQNRHLVHRRPGGAYAGPKRVTRLVQAGHRAPVAVSAFFTASQSCLSHAAITASRVCPAVACSGGDLTLPSEGEPATLSIVSGVPGNHQHGTVGAHLSHPLVVRAEGPRSQPVLGER